MNNEMSKLPLDINYFTNYNPENVYIEERDGPEPNLVVWHNNSIVDDCLHLHQAFGIARQIVNDSRKGASL